MSVHLEFTVETLHEAPNKARVHVSIRSLQTDTCSFEIDFQLFRKISERAESRRRASVRRKFRKYSKKKSRGNDSKNKICIQIYYTIMMQLHVQYALHTYRLLHLWASAY